MSLILNIETATTACSVSLGQNGKLLALKELNADYTHAENLTLFIEEVMKQSGKKLSQLDAIAVSKGPGSYTGLRIGVSTAKGLCYALEKPLISIDTLRSLAFAVVGVEEWQADTLCCPMLDARRMEVYCAVYDSGLNCIRETAAEIIDENSFSDLLKDRKVIFFGDGAAKCKEVLSKNANAGFIDNIFPSAKDLVALSESAFNHKQFEDLAYFEPFYLKDFVAGKKKVN
ncbi:MAG: tRNA (adenosine(37)-N6)-threonylcarbamoyltransferase complex dimerization subunit type 1 TsaB [Bacteroidia bacterium]